MAKVSLVFEDMEDGGIRFRFDSDPDFQENVDYTNAQLEALRVVDIQELRMQGLSLYEIASELDEDLEPGSLDKLENWDTEEDD